MSASRDDILSAVDAATAAHLIKHALTGPLAKGRLVVLATSSPVLVLPIANHVVELDNGRIVASRSQNPIRAKAVEPDTEEKLIKELAEGPPGDSLIAPEKAAAGKSLLFWA